MRAVPVLFAIVAAFSSEPAWASEPVRSSYFSGRGTLGSNDYLGLDVSAGIGVSPSTRATGRIKLSRSQDPATESESNGSGELRLGADSRLTEAVGARAQLLGRSEPSELKAAGLSVGADYELSSLWDGDLGTLVAFDLEGIAFSQADSQETVNRGKKRSKTIALSNPDIKQVTAGLTVMQEVAESASLSLSLTRYGYSENDAELTQAVKKRRFSFSGITGLVEGFPRDAVSLGGDWTPVERWTLAASVSSTRYPAEEERLFAAELSASFEALLDTEVEVGLARSGSPTLDASTTFSFGVIHRW